KLPNLHLEQWLPQIDIFAQKKLLGFVTHSGTNSITEATYFGIPLVSIEHIRLLNNSITTPI
ncbi:MAG: glycosyltransferase family 1 protein, partial [Chamaesiphon sp. CSU_1_12]|nr:glycosyltransferase family 1 protein [Chamaesiphon sp. CSU_1_12]